MASRAHVVPDALQPRLPLVRVRGGVLRLVRAPERRGDWSPEEVAHVLNSRRAEFFGVLSRRRDGAAVSAVVRQEVVDQAISLVVMAPQPIHNEQHMEGAFWTAVRLLLAEHRSGRHSVRVGSRQRVDLEVVADKLPDGSEPSEIVEARERIARAADFMAQLDPFEQQIVALMATQGIGVKLAARSLGVPTKTVVAAVRSADQKLEQVAVIAAAGRMCAYRHPAILARAHGESDTQKEQAARAHLAACAGCRSMYIAMTREMRERSYQRRASAVFLPLPAVVGHASLLDRLTALVTSHRLPSGGSSGERTAELLGGGGIAAKAAVAGTAIVVAGAGVVGLTTGIRSSGAHHPRRVPREQVQHMRPATPLIATTPSVVSPSRPRAAPSRTGSARRRLPHISTEAKATVTNFPGLGGNAPTSPATTSRTETNAPRAINDPERILKTP